MTHNDDTPSKIELQKQLNFDSETDDCTTTTISTTTTSTSSSSTTSNSTSSGSQCRGLWSQDPTTEELDDQSSAEDKDVSSESSWEPTPIPSRKPTGEGPPIAAMSHKR
uniref:Uncharacterized protein n=1 Tax=Eutreptiella gymnastica TaxID=73025 RepID=A0A7S1J046_9EUGL|mmetsp:Transcript_56521/g.100687  ORF Transcript_56521/g.100687 Transcript_56521/m.100687 type:complete len:109 (+) Transcript_56521:331-657(+)